MSTASQEDTAKQQALIPGAYERRPTVPRRFGSMSGPAYGSLNPPSGPSTMDEATLAERRKEGGEC
jgi:hypothetical protein